MPISVLDSRPVQMNVRMDRQLKEAGYAVLAHIGMTPSQAVRTLWEYLVVNGCMPSRSGVAVPSSNVPATASVESRVTQGSHIVRDACLKYGIPVPDLSGDYDDLYEEAMAERYPEWVELWVQTAFSSCSSTPTYGWITFLEGRTGQRMLSVYSRLPMSRSRLPCLPRLFRSKMSRILSRRRLRGSAEGRMVR